MDLIQRQNITSDELNQTQQFILSNANQILSSIDATDKTIKSYQYNIDLFLEFIQDNGFHLNTFRDFKKYLTSYVNLSASTKKVKFQAAKKILTELYSHYNILPKDITVNVKSPKVTSGHKKDGLTPKEVKKVLDYINQMDSGFNKARLKAVFSLLTYQGLRQFEVINIRFEDLKLSSGIIMIKGKGRDDKEIIDLHPKTIESIKEYINLSDQKDGFLFYPMSYAHKNTDRPLTTRSIRMMFSSVFKATDIDKSVHGFRHYFVTVMCDSFKGDYNRVKLFSRHKSIQSIIYYDDRKKKKSDLKHYFSAF
jgi:integrase/recombinase XerC